MKYFSPEQFRKFDVGLTGSNYSPLVMTTTEIIELSKLKIEENSQTSLLIIVKIPLKNNLINL